MCFGSCYSLRETLQYREQEALAIMFLEKKVR